MSCNCLLSGELTVNLEIDLRTKQRAIWYRHVVGHCQSWLAESSKLTS